MAITIDWGTRVISVPQADLTDLGGGIYELDIDVFRIALKNLEDDASGIVFPNTHSHNTTVTLGGVTFARTVEIINGYTVTFEDDQYAVKLVGANNNISDVTNVNQVSIRSNNSAGYIQIETGTSGLTSEESILLTQAGNASMVMEGGFTLAESIRLLNAVMLGKLSGAGTGVEVFRDIADTKDRITATVDSSGNRTAIALDAS